jgi:hypothetical protein
MSIFLENQFLIVSHDGFKGGLIADCDHAIARLPWEARTKLSRIKTETEKAFEASVIGLGGFISTRRTT